MNYLIFEYQIEGHYIEFFRHLLNYAITHKKKDIFFIASSYLLKKWVDDSYFPESENFKFIYLNKKIVDKLNRSGKIGNLYASIYRCKILKQLINKYSINKTILITLVKFFPFLPLIISRRSYISGIEYIIPYWRKNIISVPKRFEDKFRIWLYAHASALKNVYLLNDDKTPEIYNKDYNTNKFKFLPDPIDCLVTPQILNKKDDKIILLHAGRFRKEKGTFLITTALKELTDQERKKIKFILCGSSIIKEDNDRAFRDMAELSSIMETEFYNDFVQEGFLHSLYVKSDFILIPYFNYYQSSGNLGHAASYGKPIIGPSQGLLGYLIDKYNLGYSLHNLDVDSLVIILKKIINNPFIGNYNYNEYVKRCCPDRFAEILLS